MSENRRKVRIAYSLTYLYEIARKNGNNVTILKIEISNNEILCILERTWYHGPTFPESRIPLIKIDGYKNPLWILPSDRYVIIKHSELELKVKVEYILNQNMFSKLEIELEVLKPENVYIKL